jgi:predicted lipoprotein with Yx(FWY)xxD motif
MHTRLTNRSKSARWAVLPLIATAGVVVAGACTSSSHRASSAPQQGPPVTVAVGASSLGPIAVDAGGHTLYRFDKDTAGSGTSACTGTCASLWPPATVSGVPTAGPGLAGTLNLIHRGDGTSQIALDGHPLYRFSGDQNAGETSGDGFSGIWHVVHVSGSSTTATTMRAVSPTY